MDTALILSDRPSKGDGCCLPGTLLVQFHEDYLDLSLNCNLPSNVMFSHNLFDHTGLITTFLVSVPFCIKFDFLK